MRIINSDLIFFLFLKGFRPTVWETTDISVRGKNPTNVNFVIIKNQVQFIDTVKYFQQSLASLAASMTNDERGNVKESCRAFLTEKLMYVKDDDEKWILEYLSSGKETIPYQMITDFDSLNIKPEKDFFEQEKFCSCLKEDNISTEEYENVKKFFNILKLETPGDLNRIYNFQDTAILCEIFESRSALLQKLFKYSPKICNSASSFSGCVHKLKSKCRIVLPTNAKTVRVFEKTVLGRYSCINTRIGFDTNLFLNDTKNEKVLFKTIYNKLKRFSSKIIKMNENNQYGMAMTKPLP